MKNFINITPQEIKSNLIHLHDLVFETTDACNLRCKYCAFSSMYEGYDPRKNLKLSFSQAKKVIDYLNNLWIENLDPSVKENLVLGFYGGEPLVNFPLIKETIDYLKILKPCGKSLKYNMTTNAMLLEKYMDFLVENNFSLFISLDGDEKGQSYRVDAAGENSFHRVVANVKALQKKYPEYFEKNVFFTSVLHDRNSAESIYDFIFSEFGKIPLISEVNPSGVRKDKLSEFNKMHQSLSQSIKKSTPSKDLASKLESINPSVDLSLKYFHFDAKNVYNDYRSLIESEVTNSITPTGTCTPFSKKMFVSVNGKILPCERISHKYYLGYLTEEGVHLDLEKAADKHSYYINTFLNQCKSCSLKEKCGVCVYQDISVDEASQAKCKRYCSKEEDERSKEYVLSYINKHPEIYNDVINNIKVKY